MQFLPIYIDSYTTESRWVVILMRSVSSLHVGVCWTAAARWCFVFRLLTVNCNACHHLPFLLHYWHCHTDTLIQLVSVYDCHADTVNLSVMLSVADTKQ